MTACFHERQGERLTTSDEKQWDPDQYERMIRERLHSTPEAMLEDYATTVRVTPRRVRV